MTPREMNAIIDVIELGIAEAAAAFAENQYRLREQFISALAHDLRTPLTAVKSAAQLILREERLDAAQRLSSRIVQSINRTELMVEDLLDTNLMRSGRSLALSLTQGDFREFVQEGLDETSEAIGDRFTYDPGAVPILGYWDKRYIKRALDNLMINAVKYGNPARPGVISLSSSGGQVQLAVHNEGEPIPADNRAQLFDLFERGPQAKEASSTGWGLGLALVKGIAEAHGGGVSVESSQEAGTTFTLTLPLDARTHVRYDRKVAA